MRTLLDDERDSDFSRVDTGQYAPSKDVDKDLIDFEFLWLNFEAHILGGSVERDEKTGNWVKRIPKGAKPYLNEKGVKDILTMFKMTVNPITGYGITLQDRVQLWCERFQKSLATMLYVNRREYEIEEGKYSIIIDAFMFVFEMNASRSIGGKGLIYKYQSEHRVISERIEPPQNKGMVLLGKRWF